MAGRQQDLEREARIAEADEHKTRQLSLIKQHGKPERIDLDEALWAIGRPTGVTAADVWASIYRDSDAADAWMKSNLEHHGHPELGRKTLEDGRVVGVLDLRPALRRLAEADARRVTAESEH